MATIQQEKLIEHAVLSIQKLRGSVSKTYQHLQDGVTSTEDEEDKVKAFVTKLQEDLSTINDNYTYVQHDFNLSLLKLT